MKTASQFRGIIKKQHSDFQLITSEAKTVYSTREEHASLQWFYNRGIDKLVILALLTAINS